MRSRYSFQEHRQEFANRRDAGQQLARRLMHLAGQRPVVLDLPRGGVPVAYEIARALHAPLDVLFVRKLGAPGQPELGLGAVVDGAHPQRILNERLIEQLQPSQAWLEEEERRQLELIEERKRRWRPNRPAEPLDGRTVILVDDGIATGGTVRAALLALGRSGAARTVLAVPVAPAGVLDRLPISQADFICLLQPDDLVAVGYHYADFTQTTDEEVVELLDRAQQALRAA